MSNEEPKNETEILSADDQKLREMCLSLKKIEAPKDFDFQLKARIANSNPGDFQPRFGLSIRYALPVLALIFVLGFLAYNSGMFFSSKNNATIRGSLPETANPALPQNTMVSKILPPQEKELTTVNSANSISNQNFPKVSKTEIAENNLRNPKAEKKRVEKKDNFNGSELKSQKLAPLVQPDFNSNTVPQKPQNIENTTPMRVKDILLTIGINAVFEKGQWNVKSIIQNTLAESSGIKANDVVEAIDNQPISSEKILLKTFSGKIVTILRGGKKLEIVLQN